MNSLDNIWKQCLGNGPGLALCDPHHPGCRGLPDVNAAIVLRASDQAERDRILKAGSDGFSWPYGGPRGEPREAWFPWDALLAVSGTPQPNQRVTAFRTAELMPEWAGGDPAVRHAMQRLTGGRPGRPPEWHVGGPAEPSGPDKREAIQALSQSGGLIVLVVHPEVEGVWLNPPPPAQLPESLSVIRPGEFRVTGLGIEGSQAGTTGPMGGVRLPWPAIAAMQNAATGQGWFWPEDLPAHLAERVPDAGPRAGGQPLAPRPIAPVLDLPAPPEVDKRRAITGCMKQGGAVVLIDPNAEGAVVPGDFGDLPLLAVPLNPQRGQPPPSTTITGLYVKASLPDFHGNLRRLTLPWNAIWAVSAQAGARVHNWPADQPEVVNEALRAAEQTAGETSSEGTMKLSVPGWGIGQLGQIVVAQPVGQDENGETQALVLEFRLNHQGPAG